MAKWNTYSASDQSVFVFVTSVCCVSWANQRCQRCIPYRWRNDRWCGWCKRFGTAAQQFSY